MKKKLFRSGRQKVIDLKKYIFMNPAKGNV